MGLNGAKGRVYSHQDFLGNLPVRLEPVQYDPGKKLVLRPLPPAAGCPGAGFLCTRRARPEEFFRVSLISVITRIINN